MTIHFVCRGNAFRSIMAEAYLNSLAILGLEVISSGTVAGEYKEPNSANFPKTLAVLDSHGIKTHAKDYYAEDLSQESLDKSDIVIFLNQRAHDEAAQNFNLPKETIIWDVTDIGEPGRIANSEDDRMKLGEDVYQEISKNVDDLSLVLKKFK